MEFKICALVLLFVVPYSSALSFKLTDNGELALNFLGGLLQKINIEPTKTKTVNPIHIPNPLLPTLLPNLTKNDPAALPDTKLEFDYDLINGTHNYSDSFIHGLSTLRDDAWLTIKTPTYGIRYLLSAKHLSIGGNYNSNLKFFKQTFDFFGYGNYHVNITNLRVGVSAKLTATADPSVIVSDLEFEFGFDDLNMNADKSAFNCIAAHWDEIAFEIKLIVETYWPTLDTKILRPFIQPLANHLLQNCDLTDLLQGQLNCAFQHLPPIYEIQKMLEKFEEILLRFGDNLSKYPWPRACGGEYVLFGN